MGTGLERILFRPPSHSPVRWLLIGAGLLNILVSIVLAIAYASNPFFFVRIMGVTLILTPYTFIDIFCSGLMLLLLGMAESLPTGRTTLAGNLRIVAVVLAVIVVLNLLRRILLFIAIRL